MSKYRCLILGVVCASVACGHDAGPGPSENEFITTVILQWTPLGDGDARRFVFDDADGDGGDPPSVDSIDVTAGDYQVDVFFENRLEDPAEDITVEVADEAQEHQVFFTGTAVRGPASDNPDAVLAHSYDDMDANSLPLGLRNRISASTGSGELTITLRHLPPLSGVPQKTENAATQVSEGGFAAIGGDSDAQVQFSVAVQ